MHRSDILFSIVGGMYVCILYLSFILSIALHCFRLKFNCLVLLYTIEMNSILYTLYRPLKILNITPDLG